MINFNRHFSRNVLVQLGSILAALGVLIYIQRDFIMLFYLHNQLTDTGLIINTVIVALFFLGLGKVAITLLRYTREEKALAVFIEAMIQHQDPQDVAGEGSIIGRRYVTLHMLHRKRAPINHSALAATLQASESVHLTFPRFINNILILMGVFGTIISLSVALVGASNLLDVTHDIGDMGLVIHGMSTALSTTISAIVCYLFFGYSYLKLADAQTHLLGAVEQVTSLDLLPLYVRNSDGILNEVATLLQELRTLTDTMRAAQYTFINAANQIQGMVDRLNDSVEPMSTSLKQIKSILRDGFRLPGPHDE